jgi:hypothetical protein
VPANNYLSFGISAVRKALAGRSDFVGADRPSIRGTILWEKSISCRSKRFITYLIVLVLCRHPRQSCRREVCPMRNFARPRQLVMFGVLAILGGIWIYSNLPVQLRSTDRLIGDLGSLGHRFDFEEKIATVRRLGDMRSPKAVDALIAVLDRPWPGESFSSIALSLYEDQDDQLLSAVATALGSIGDERAVTPLLRAARYSYNNSKRRLDAQVQTAIRQIGSKSVPNLVSVLNGSDRDLRCGALRALAGLRDSRAVSAIAGVLPEGCSGSCDMGEFAAQALVAAGDPGIDALVSATGDQREAVQKTAICSLARARNPRAKERWWRRLAGTTFPVNAISH